MKNEEQRENSKEKKKQTDYEVVVEMKNYLYAKYGDIDYELVALRRKNNWDMPYDLLLLTTSDRGTDEAEFCVERFEQDGKYVCADNYVELLVADEFEGYMKEYTNKYFSEFKLYAIASGYEGQVFPMSFKTFGDIRDRYDEIPDIIPQNSFLLFEVAVKESSLKNAEAFDAIAEKYKEDLDELGFAWCYNLACVDDESFDELK